MSFNNVLTAKNIFSPAFCKELEKLVDTEMSKKRYEKESKKNTLKVNLKSRNNHKINFINPELAEYLFSQLKSKLKKLNSNEFTCIGIHQDLRFYKYYEGQDFIWHVDGSFVVDENNFSLYSLLVYINEDFEGGETEFIDGLIIKPKTGNAVIFEHKMKHCGRKVLNGVKYILRGNVLVSRNS